MKIDFFFMGKKIKKMRNRVFLFYKLIESTEAKMPSYLSFPGFLPSLVLYIVFVTIRLEVHTH